jgi:hypothetical protein
MTEIIDTNGFDLENSRPHLLIGKHHLPHRLGSTERPTDYRDDFRRGKNYNPTGFFHIARVYFLSNVALKKSPLPQRKLINPSYDICRRCE